MIQVTVRLRDGRRLVATRILDGIRLTLDGDEVGVLALPQAWQFAEGIDRLATAAARDRRPAAQATPRARRRGR